MLSELRIRNFALIDRLSVRLGPGLNVLTGETGAGKSIIVGALSLLLGERASSEVVRSGEDRASIEGVFEVDGREDLARLLDERGIDADDGVIVLKREVAAEGRSRAWVNGSPATASLLGEIGRMLVDLHGQHEHQTLLRRDEQRAILDAYAGTGDLVARVRAAHGALADLRREVADLERRRREALQRADFLRFQADEIEKAALKPGEEDALEDEARRLSHSEELTSLSAQLYDAVTGSDRSILGELGHLSRAVDHLIRIDPAQEGVRELYDTAYYTLQELGERMERYAQTVEHDPRRLDEIRRRQDVIFRLRTKYGGTVDEVLQIGAAARQELDLADGADFELGALQKRMGHAADELARLAAELTERRTEAAARLAEEVSAVLPDLGMTGGRFEVARLPLAEPSAFGAEEIEFRVSLNRGFEPRALSFVASGGEMSRIMLALKTILARLDAIPTLVFDEVDAGIGGRVALQVGDKMREVAAGHQVFAITHLPQIASRATTHLLVSKHERDGRTATEVAMLEDHGRVREIARMLGGDPESAVSLEHARELLERGVAVS
ncbi:DNA repair protein RecN [Longimicrobium sp.]|uniref:DNA repair protein RecN n=1 Tax=Longimicrobium sp. TaxID=2029185 RepID=UPI002D0BA418|nr:DNA repair protein RecN [Longimicrobium sp.]HSU12802.1 DNA repair protein RecN [Longimicrobium sp.]